MPYALLRAVFFVRGLGSARRSNPRRRRPTPSSRLTAEVTDGLLRLSIDDDGVGGADPAHGSGLVGLRDRVEAVGWETVRTQSEPGKRTWLLVELPLGPGPRR
jgi:glucose-6-phosphate-specific signal transduction histidine kinase